MLLFAALGLGLLTAAYFLLKAEPPPDVAPLTAAVNTAAESAAPPTAAPSPPMAAYVVAKGQRVSGPDTIRVRQGEDVLLSVTSDHADELHVHGYDLHGKLLPGQPLELRFKAEHSGRFDIELHHNDLALGALEVMPQ